MHEGQRTYALTSSQELKPSFPLQHCSSTSTSCQWKERNGALTQNETLACSKKQRTITDQRLFSRKSTGLTYTLTSLSPKNNWNTSCQFPHELLNSSIPQLANRTNDHPSLKHPPPYSYFHEISIDNLRRFKELKGENSARNAKKRPNSLQGPTRAYSFDDSNRKAKQSLQSSKGKSRKTSSLTPKGKAQGKAKSMRNSFTDLNKVSNSSHPHSKDRNSNQEPERINEMASLHYDYNQPTFDTGQILSRSSQSLQNPIKSQISPKDYQSSNHTHQYPYKDIASNSSTRRSQIPNANASIEHNAHQSPPLGEQSTVREIDEKERRMQMKEERDRRFQLEKKKLQERRKVNEDAMRKERDDELKRRENWRYQKALEDKPGLNKEEERHSMSKRLIEKYSPISEAQNQGRGSIPIDKAMNDFSFKNQQKPSNSLAEVNQNETDIIKRPKEKRIDGNEPNQQGLLLSVNQSNANLSKEQTDRNIQASYNPKLAKIEEEQKSKQQLRSMKPLSLPQQDQSNMANHQINQQDESVDQSDEKEKMKSSPRKLNSFQNKLRNMSQTLLNSSTLLDVKEKQLNNSFDKGANSKQGTDIEKKIYDWLGNFSMKEGNKEPRNDEINVKAQNIINTLKQSVSHSSQLHQPSLSQSTKVQGTVKKLSSMNSIKKLQKTAVSHNQEETAHFYRANDQSLLHKKKPLNHFKSKKPFHFLQDSAQSNDSTSLFTSRTFHKERLFSLIQSSRQSQDIVMPPNPFDTVVKAREFFFFED